MGLSHRTARDDAHRQSQPGLSHLGLPGRTRHAPHREPSPTPGRGAHLQHDLQIANGLLVEAEAAGAGGGAVVVEGLGAELGAEDVQEAAAHPAALAVGTEIEVVGPHLAQPSLEVVGGLGEVLGAEAHARAQLPRWRNVALAGRQPSLLRGRRRFLLVPGARFRHTAAGKGRARRPGPDPRHPPHPRCPQRAGAPLGGARREAERGRGQSPRGHAPPPALVRLSPLPPPSPQVREGGGGRAERERHYLPGRHRHEGAVPPPELFQKSLLSLTAAHPPL